MPMLLTALLATSLTMQVRVEVDKRTPQDTVKRGTDVNISIGSGGRRRRGDTLTVVKDSTDTTSLATERRRRNSVARRLPVTASVLATAFRNPAAHILLDRARAARISQDSSLMAYDATSYQRISAGMSLTKLGRDRLIFRVENVSRVRWQRGVGVWVDVKGQRAVIPIAPASAQKEAQHDMAEDNDGMAAIPYFPGQEELIFGGSDMLRSQVDERQMVHPLARGAEAYYFYEAGDSVDIRLPDRSTVRLRELRVRPRQPKWNVIVGSLWFDAARGQLVRAAYRFAEPLDVWTTVKEEDPHAMDDVPFWVKPMISPLRGQITAVAVDYGLFEGRFWLPRVRAMEGSAQATFMRIPFKFEQRFTYASVNVRDSLPPIVVAQGLGLDTLPDSTADRLRDSIRTARRAHRDSVRNKLIPAATQVTQCDTSATRVVTRGSRNETGDVAFRIAYRTPCDVEKLAHSPDLPKSIFDPGDELFGANERDALIAQAISLGAQPPFLLGSGHLPPPVIQYGLALTRYNRVEGLSLGARVEQPLGAGYTARLLGRLGTADLEPNAELSLSRTDLVHSWTLTGYNRLVAANDWGDPLSFGSSMSALLFGRDEGFYYRTSGASITRLREPRSEGARIAWTVFAEDQRSARQETSWSLGPAFVPNITASSGAWAGTTLRVNHSAGLDPRGFRLLGDIRLEAATALRKRDSLTERFARGAADFTLSRGLPWSLTGAMTLGGGTSAGQLPAQRRWYLGGTQTVRGQRPDTAAAGNAYWLTRAELGYEGGAWRPLVFGDLGWVGDREQLYRGTVGRPMSGAGAGVSFMDGLVRFDVARGIYPQRRWRVDLYLESRF